MTTSPDIPTNIDRKIRQMDNDVAAIYEMLGNISSDQKRCFIRLDAVDMQLLELGGRLNGVDLRLDRVDERLSGIDGHLAGIDTRLGGMDKRFDGMDKRFDDMDKRFDAADQRADNMDGKLDQILVLLGGDKQLAN
jgi:archaellum component FlaC